VRKPILLTLVLIAVAITIAAASCGDEDDSGSSGRPTDRAFAAEMIPHHEGAIEMAQVAQARAERPEIRRLARSIITSQREEIAILRSIQSDLRGDGGVVGDLGLSEEHMAQEGDVDRLREASNFDREFIQMMIPHHGGAIDMAAVELRDGQDPRLKRIARSIIEAQQREIQQMEGWFAEWYGEEPQLESSGEHPG
jgi:uncharacterized protein (DUF305 family)